MYKSKEHISMRRSVCRVLAVAMLVVACDAPDGQPEGDDEQANAGGKADSVPGVAPVAPETEQRLRAIGAIDVDGISTAEQLDALVDQGRGADTHDFEAIARIYIEEGRREGVNYDLAFVQAAWESDFFATVEGNNPVRLATIGGGNELAEFPTLEIGVRAHIQHLLAYGTTREPTTDIVDPRFLFVTRGIAPLAEDLGGRWTAERSYGRSLRRLLTQLYASQ